MLEALRRSGASPATFDNYETPLWERGFFVWS
jgi:hypothetical protein